MKRKASPHKLMVRRIRVPLTEAKRAEIAVQMAAWTENLESLEDEKRELSRTYGDRIKHTRKMIGASARDVRENAQYEDLMVWTEMAFGERMVRYYTEDNEMVEERSMTDQEIEGSRQPPLEMEAPDGEQTTLEE